MKDIVAKWLEVNQILNEKKKWSAKKVGDEFGVSDKKQTASKIVHFPINVLLYLNKTSP